MARAIDSETAFRFLTEQLVKETGKFSEGVNKGLNIARSAMSNEDAIPTLPQPAGWISVEERLPNDEADGETVLVIVSGKPRKNITLVQACLLGGYFESEGWILDEYPEWENPIVTHWMPLPAPPDITRSKKRRRMS